MSLDQYANIAEIVGIALVIASLFYVAKQLKQNTGAIQAQTRHAVLAAAQAELFAQVQDPEINYMIISDEELTLKQQVKTNCFLFAIFRSREFAWLQYRNGVIDDTQWQTERAVIVFFLDMYKVRQWWDHVGRIGFSPEFAAFIAEVMSESEATNTSFVAASSWNH